MKRIVIILLAIMLCGCGNQNIAQETTVSDEKITLWVVTEETVWDGMNHQAEQRIKEFEAEYGNVTVELDVLPTDAEERAVYLESLRTQIIAGTGPDAYLLPTGNVLTLEQPKVYTYVTVESLFSDVRQAMYNGLFADISQYYDTDVELNNDSLETAVMDAGVIGEARYVLPLRYNIPVIYAHTEALESSGLDLDAMASGIHGLMSTVIEKGDPVWCCGAYVKKLYSRSAFSCFSEVIDYENQEVLITVEELVEVMEKLQIMESLVCEDFYNNGWSIGLYIEGGVSWDDNYYPMFVGDLNNSLSAVTISNALNLDLTMIPLRATDGDLVANVTYYAAVGAGSHCPKLAYEFLRGFLTEEYQWEQNRPDANRKYVYMSSGMIENSWPVRSEEAAKHLFEAYRNYYSNITIQAEGATSRKKAVLSTNVTDEVIPVLDAEIDRARFQIAPEWNVAVAMGSVTEPNVDIDILAEEIVQELKWHVAEG